MWKVRGSVYSTFAPRVVTRLPCSARSTSVRRRSSASVGRGDRHFTVGIQSYQRPPPPPRRLEQQRQQLRRHPLWGLRCHEKLSAIPSSAGSARSFSSARVREAASRDLEERNRKLAIYMASIVTAVLGVSYAAVPLYKVFCQVTGFGGTTQVATEEKALKMKPVEGGRVIRVTFDGGTADTMPWKFRPTQSDVKVVPGETALAFFTAKNPTKKHITGVATYNVFPLKAGIYFNKIQCFCFEEQRLRAGEEIDMPVFFFLDPEMLDDPTMDNVNNVTLSYTFFQTAEERSVNEDQREAAQ